jgi:hypothetical protein
MKLKHQADPYPLRDRVRPFFKGIMDASPLVEVSLEGLKRDLGAKRRENYIVKVARSGSTNHIFRAFLSGLSEAEQDMLGEAFEKRYEAAKSQYDRDVYESESALGAPMTFELKRMYIRDSVGNAFMLLRDGHVGSEKAQLIFAGIIYADGLVEHAIELIGNKSLGAFAQQILKFKCYGNEHVA